MGSGNSKVPEEERTKLLARNSSHLNIAFCGAMGAGKSSLINGINAAVTQKAYTEIARTGMSARSESVTQTVQRFPKCGADRRGDLDPGHGLNGLPNLIDIAGFPDENSPAYQELLKAILFGRVQHEGDLREPMRVAGDNPEDVQEILKLYPVWKDCNARKEMKVDRLVFVASAMSAIPEKLMKLVNNAALPGASDRTNKREIPLFLAITHMDQAKKNDEHRRKIKKMAQILGMQGKEDLTCVEIANYNEELTPRRKSENCPQVDRLILNLLLAVTDPSLSVVNDSFEPEGGDF